MTDKESLHFLEEYVLSQAKAVRLLVQNEFFGQALIIMYASIDTLGLLDAPDNQINATTTTFTNWCDKYLISQPNISVTSIDLWAARCAVLHTFTSASSLSRSGKAKEIAYFSGDKESEPYKTFVKITPTIMGGNHVPIHIGDLFDAYLQAILDFLQSFSSRCTSNPTFRARLRNVLKQYSS